VSPALRFFVFDKAPNLERTRPPLHGAPLQALPAPETAAATVERLFWYALGRAPSPEERRIAEAAVVEGATAGTLSTEGIADLLWALLMKPEFQLIY
jgi:hypothetical protein